MVRRFRWVSLFAPKAGTQCTHIHPMVIIVQPDTDSLVDDRDEECASG